MHIDTISLFENILADKVNSVKALLMHPDFKVADGDLMVPFGITADGQLISDDVAKIPHMLIGGTTGTGKTSFIQALIISLMSQYGPDKCKYIIYDSKLVDYMSFNGIPHLLLPVINDPRKAEGAIYWLKHEVLNRIERIRDNTTNDDDFHIFMILDDLAEMQNSEEMRDELYEILKLGKKVKIHCIISTGLPIAQIVPEEFKMYIPCRIAFSMVSKQASRIIIDENGAEMLEVPGEIIYKNYSKKQKCYSAYINDIDVNNIVRLLVQKMNEDYNLKLVGEGLKKIETQDKYEVSDGRDELFVAAGRIVIERKMASVSMLQRYLRIGYKRAECILHQLEEAGVIQVQELGKPSNILMSLMEFEKFVESARSE